MGVILYRKSIEMILMKSGYDRKTIADMTEFEIAMTLAILEAQLEKVNDAG